MTDALPHDDRPVDPTPIHTAELPATPVRDRRIPAAAWIEAPDELLDLAAALEETNASDGTKADEPGALPPVTSFLRRIGPWLLWRCGPARGPAIYWAGHADDLTSTHVLRLDGDGTTTGTGPSGAEHQRFRTWKQDLRDHA